MLKTNNDDPKSVRGDLRRLFLGVYLLDYVPGIMDAKRVDVPACST